MTAYLKRCSTPSGSSDLPSFSSLEALFREALKEKIFSGASLLLGTPETILLYKNWGYTRQNGSPVDFDTRFDLASLTKPLVTAALSMWAIHQNKLRPEDTLSSFFPRNLLPIEKREITLAHLLNHCSGLPPYKPFFRKLISIPVSQRASTLLQWILETPLLAPPEKESHYSDLGFILLGMLLERVLEKPPDRLASRFLFDPLKIGSLSFRPLEAHSPRQVTYKSQTGEREAPFISYAATEQCSWRGRLLEGEVHDENAYVLGGIAGHAGLFGTASGIYRWLQFLWNIERGTVRHAQWSASVLKTFWQRQNFVPHSTWALGFDTPSAAHSSAGDFFSSRSIGHLGFTGTSFWMDLEQEVIVILLTNRVYPTRENDKIRAFRPQLHNLMMKAFHELSRT